MMNNGKQNQIWPADARCMLAAALLCACLLFVLNLAGCSSSTEPEVKPPTQVTLQFSPAETNQELGLGETMAFSTSASPAASVSATWYQGGLEVGQDSLFNYLSSSVGLDTLTVNATSGSVQEEFSWVINVLEDVSDIPPEVPNVDARAGNEPSDVLVTWTWVNGAKYDLVEYLVAFSYDGPVNEGNWDQATPLGVVPVVPGRIGYTENFSAAVHDLIPGGQAWFAVRVRDDKDQLSILTSSIRHDITWPWYLGGYVTDDVGQPLLGVIVNSNGPGFSANTDQEEGYFLFDRPFFNTDLIRVGTNSPSSYNFLTAPVAVEQDTTLINITLINHYGLDYVCWDGEFLNYLRFMTYTSEVGKSRLNRWDEYPISVFIPPQVNPAGIDMEAASLAALEFFNSAMNSDAVQLGIEETAYLVRTADQASAGIEFTFDERPLIQGYGEATLLLPSEPDVQLGRVIPEKMQIWVNSIEALSTFETVQGVALHEFGHTLGLLGHEASCSGSEYLMQPAGGLGAMARAQPIHLDERRAIRAIRNIKQGSNMDDYTKGKADFGELPSPVR